MISVKNKVVEQKFFPDGTFNLMNFPDVFDTLSLAPQAENFTATICWKYKSITEQVLLYNVAKHLRNIGYDKLYLVMPYVPNARMDRTHYRVKEVPTLKFFADFINDLKFDVVAILDPHSDTTPMLLNNCVMLDRAQFFQRAVEYYKPDVVLYPDAGAMKRYAEDSGKLPFICAEKVRDWKTGKIKGLEIQNPQSIELNKQTRVLISDDLCSKGGTFYHAGKALQEQFGIEHIALYVTHCEDSVQYGNLFKEYESPIETVYTTDSIEREFKHDHLVTYPFFQFMHSSYLF